MNIIEIMHFAEEDLLSVQKFINKLTSRETRISADFYREILDSPNSHLFFIKDEDTIAGMLTVGIYKSPTGSKAWIEDVVVDENYRGQGLGRQLVEYAIRYARSQKVDLLMLTSSSSRIAANKLYQTAGFELKQTNVYKMNLD